MPLVDADYRFVKGKMNNKLEKASQLQDIKELEKKEKEKSGKPAKDGIQEGFQLKNMKGDRIVYGGRYNQHDNKARIKRLANNRQVTKKTSHTSD